MEILQANESHIDWLIQLRLDFYEDLGHGLGEDTEELAAAMRQYYPAALAEGRFAAWFIVEDEKPVSTAYALFNQTLPGRRTLHGKLCTVQNVFTYPEYRGKGYAKALMRHVVDYARENGVELLDLFATEAGAKIYYPMGFVKGMDDPYLSLYPQRAEDGYE